MARPVVNSNDALVAQVMAEHPGWLRGILRRLDGYPHVERCWLWSTDIGADYGRVRIPRAMGVDATVVVHRVVWLALVGPIDQGFVLDHDGADGCSNRACANPSHLEPVTTAHNTAVTGRSWAARNAAKRYCPAGHPLIAGNLTADALRRGQRQCLTCTKLRERDRTDALRAASRALGISQYEVMRRYGRSTTTYRSPHTASNACRSPHTWPARANNSTTQTLTGHSNQSRSLCSTPSTWNLPRSDAHTKEGHHL